MSKEILSSGKLLEQLFLGFITAVESTLPPEKSYANNYLQMQSLILPANLMTDAQTFLDTKHYDQETYNPLYSKQN